MNEVLASLDAEFAKLYEATGRESIPPEWLLRASLLQAFYSIRSERQLMEQLDYNLLFRWFVGLGVDDAVWDHSTFSKNRDRLLEADVAAKFLEAVLRHPKVKRFLSDEHFSVDGTLVEAWASLEELPRQGWLGRAAAGPAGGGQEGATASATSMARSARNDTHASTTDPEAKLYKKGKGKEAKLSFMGHALMENRHGLVVQADATQANGTAEREAALEMIDRHAPGTTNRLTLGADKAYDARGVRRRSAAEVRDAARGAEGQELRHRRAHDAACRLRRQPEEAQARRGGLRLGQDHCRLRQDQGARARPRAPPLHLGNGRLQSDPHAEAARRSRLSAGSQPAGQRPRCPLDPILKREYASQPHPSSTACC